MGLRPVLLALLLALASPGAPAAGEDEDRDEGDWEGQWSDPWGNEDASRLRWTGFVEGGAVWRWANVENLDSMTLGDLRLRAETRYDHRSFRIDFKGDLAWDQVVEEVDADVRELVASFRAGSRTDIRLGRQVLTWGTGDLLFLNDLFPKDWQSFFIGRDGVIRSANSASSRLTDVAQSCGSSSMTSEG